MPVAVSKPVFKTTDVSKVIEPFIDEPNLLIIDRDPEEDNAKIPTAEELLSRSRDNVQCLFNKIWELKRVINKDAVCAELPEKEKYRLPREKPIPGKKESTKWEQFAKQKGIVKQKKAKKVYDDATGEWKPTYGYRSKDNAKDWVMEVPENGDPNKDYFAEKKQKKTERIAKNKTRQLQNEIRAVKANGKNSEVADNIPIGVGGRTELASKNQLTYQIHKTKMSTASGGKFEPAMKGEKKPKLGIKRKFLPNVSAVESEKERQLKILSTLGAKKPKIQESRLEASEQAIQKATVAETGESSASRNAKQRPKGRSKNSTHRQQHFKAIKKGKVSRSAGKGPFRGGSKGGAKSKGGSKGGAKPRGKK